MVAIPVNFVVIVSFLFLIFYALGIHDYLTRVEENACEMTYMFEYPQYVELSLSPDVQKKFPRYALYGYNEGRRTEELRKMQFSGIPVIFVPGNSGSHRQGRSLASVALRKALNSRLPFHFDFYLVDFNEDLSAIYGGVLNDQAEFLRFCIEKVLHIYRNVNVNSVVLIGHSAGGIVAKSVFIDSNFDPEKVRLIITLATPHLLPVIQSDFYITDFYESVNNIWNPRSENVSHVTLISIGGGKRDALVRSDLTKDLSADINVLTTAVPGVYCSTDHLSITWCKQLMLAIVRALIDSVDIQTKQISENMDYRNSIFNYHLIKRSAGKKFTPHSMRAGFERNARWVENLLRQFSVVEKAGLKKPQFLMLRLIDDVKHEAVVIETVNLNVKDWIYVCNADLIHGDSRICDEGINLSNLTEIRPAQKLRRKLVQLDLFPLKSKGFSHVLVRIAPSTSFVQVNVDIYQKSSRNLVHPVPRIVSFTRDVVVEQTVDNAVYYTVTLPGFEQIWQGFSLGLEALTCKATSSHAVVSFSVPWANETSHFYLVDKPYLSASLTLTSVRPLRFNRTAAPILTFTLDPSCKYKITLSPDKVAVAGQMARFYSGLLPAYIVAVLLLTLEKQLQTFEMGKGVPLYHNALTQSIRSYYVVLQAAIIGSKIFGYLHFAHVAFSGLPIPDAHFLQEAGQDFFLLPIFLFGVAAALNYLFGAVVYAAIIISGQAAHKLAFRFMAKTITGFIFASEWAMSALHQLPFVAATLLVSLTFSTAGGLAVSLAAAFYFLKLCKLYEDYLEALLKMSLKFVARTIRKVAVGLSKSTVKSSEGLETTPEEDCTNKDENKEPVSVEQINEVVAEVEEVREQIQTEEGAAVEAVEEAVVEAVEGKEVKLTVLEEIHFHVTICLLYLVSAALMVPSILAWSRSFHQSSNLILDPGFIPGIILPASGCILWPGSVPSPNRSFSRLSLLPALASLSIIFGSVSHYRIPYFVTTAVLYVVVHQMSARWLQ